MVWQAAGDGTLAGRLTPGPASQRPGGAGPLLLNAGLLLWGQVSLQGTPKSFCKWRGLGTHGGKRGG